MNRGIGLGIGIAAVIVAVVVAGSTIFSDGKVNSFSGLPNEDNNQMTMGDKVSVTVTSAEETNVSKGSPEEETTEGKNLEVNLVDGVSATSTP